MSSSNTQQGSNDSSSRKRGNVNNKFECRKKIIQQREDIIDEFHLQLQADNGESPLILIELDKREWKRLQPNSIYISNSNAQLPDKTHVSKKKIFYNTIEYGKNLMSNKNNITSKKLVMKDESACIDAEIVNIQAVKKSIVAIVTDKEDVLNVYTNFISISSNATPGSPKNPLFKGSNKVLLCFFKHECLKSPDNDECSWNSKLLPKLQQTKPNICTNNGTNNHFRSQGYISAWGNKAFYGKISETSTVSQYVSKSPSKTVRIEEVERLNMELEDIVAKEVELSVARITHTFPNISQLIAPILNVAYQK